RTDMVECRRGAEADDKLVYPGGDCLRRNGIAGAVSANRLRLVDPERNAPAHRIAARDERLDPEIFVGKQAQIVERSRHDGRNDHRVDVAAVVPLDAPKLVEPDHIFVGRAAAVGRDPPAREQLGAAKKRELGVCVADINREQHGYSPLSAGRSSTSPAWISMTFPPARRKRSAPSGARPSNVPATSASDTRSGVPTG